MLLQMQIYFRRFYDTLDTHYSKTCVKWPLSKRLKLGFKTNYRLMQVRSIGAFCNIFDLR